jgi:Ca2+-binding RTX toxin-like protein
VGTTLAKGAELHLSPRAALAGGLLAAAVILIADTADASSSVAVKKRTLLITGNAGSDTLVLRVRGGSLVAAGTRVSRRRFDRIRVRAGAGNDSVRVLSTGRAPVTLEGGSGDDTLLGGPRRDLLIGGKGKDVADGNGGNDRVRLGAGDDRFAWQPGDGNDTVDGAAGTDALAFAGSDAAEAFRLTRAGAQGGRARFTRDVDGIVTSLARVERVDMVALGGADSLTVDDQSATAVRSLTADLGAADGASDRVTVNGSSGSDAIQLGDSSVTGLSTAISVAGRDELTVNALAGDDTISTAGLTTAFTADGGDGADALALTGGGQEDNFSALADGGRVRLSRDGGSLALTLDDLERLDVALLDGPDSFTVGDLAGTDVTRVNAALGQDAASDGVDVNGSGGDDTFTALGDASGVTVAANALTVAVSQAQPQVDRLHVSAFGGADSVTSSALAAGVVRFTGATGTPTSSPPAARPAPTRSPWARSAARPAWRGCSASPATARSASAGLSPPTTSSRCRAWRATTTSTPPGCPPTRSTCTSSRATATTSSSAAPAPTSWWAATAPTAWTAGTGLTACSAAPGTTTCSAAPGTTSCAARRGTTTSSAAREPTT